MNLEYYRIGVKLFYYLALKERRENYTHLFSYFSADSNAIKSENAHVAARIVWSAGYGGDNLRLGRAASQCGLINGRLYKPLN